MSESWEGNTKAWQEVTAVYHQVDDLRSSRANYLGISSKPYVQPMKMGLPLSLCVYVTYDKDFLCTRINSSAPESTTQ